MRAVIIKSLVLLVTSVAAFFAVHASLAYLTTRAQTPGADAIWVWGDSRTVLGVDLPVLEAMARRPVHGFAQAGATVSDFCVFVDHVPAGADVLVGASLPMISRAKARDFNRGGFTVGALATLAAAGYGPLELFEIVERNRNPFLTAYQDEHSVGRVENDIIAAGQSQWFEAMLSVVVVPPFAVQKQAVLRACLKQLVDQGSRVTVVELPVSDWLSNVRGRSAYRDFSGWLRTLAGPAVRVAAPLVLSSDRNLFADHSHLNSRGRILATEAIARDLLAVFDPAANGAARPQPRTDAYFTSRWDAQRALTASTALDVLLIGDSIAEGLPADQWAAGFGRWRSANLSIGGDGTEHVLWRLKNGALGGSQPKAIVLAVGTNDLGPHGPANAGYGVWAVVETLAELAPQAKILVLGVLPRSRLPEAPLRLAAARANAVISRVAGDRVRYVAPPDSVIGADGIISQAVLHDWVHPTAAGYALWLDSWLPELEEMLAP